MYRRPSEIARRAAGAVLEFAIKAYGGAAALSVALSGSETVGGKIHDAAAAVPNLQARYRQAKYVIDHGEEIQGALDYVARHAPSADQIEETIQKSQHALEGVRTVFEEVERAKEAIQNVSWVNLGDSLTLAVQHAQRAWVAMPDLDSIDHLTQTAERIGPALGYLQTFDIDLAQIYQGLCALADNFARDEIWGTLGVMAGALALAYVLGTAAGFWGRRGRPGLIVSALQKSGARFFPGWYKENLSDILGERTYALARQHFDDAVARDPERALSLRAYQAVETSVRAKIEVADRIGPHQGRSDLS